jgi:hypothetical protein
MSSFLMAAWAVHPELISEEVGCVVPEPEEPFTERVPPLFLSSSYIVHSPKRDTLQFRAVLWLLEVHDFSPPVSDSSNDVDDGGAGARGSGWPRAFIRSWPLVHRLEDISPSSGDPWPVLPHTGGGCSGHGLLLIGPPPPPALPPTSTSRQAATGCGRHGQRLWAAASYLLRVARPLALHGLAGVGIHPGRSSQLKSWTCWLSGLSLNSLLWRRTTRWLPQCGGCRFAPQRRQWEGATTPGPMAVEEQSGAREQRGSVA